MTFWESIAIFLASLISIAYEMLIKAQDTINRKTMLVKLLGAVLVSFFIVPALIEYFSLSIRAGLFITVIIAYGLDELLNATVKRGEKNHLSKKVENVLTGEIWQSITAASQANNINLITLSYYLNSPNKNKTTLRFLQIST